MVPRIFVAIYNMPLFSLFFLTGEIFWAYDMEDNVSLDTYNARKFWLRKRILPEIGYKKIKDVCGKDLDDIYEKMIIDSYQNCSLFAVCAVLSNMFNTAIKKDIIVENPLHKSKYKIGINFKDDNDK